MRVTAELIQRLLARRLTQCEISRRTGIPQPRLSKWARGRVPGSADDALKLKALDEELARAEVVEPPRPCAEE